MGRTGMCLLSIAIAASLALVSSGCTKGGGERPKAAGVAKESTATTGMKRSAEQADRAEDAAKEQGILDGYEVLARVDYRDRVELVCVRNDTKGPQVILVQDKVTGKVTKK